MSAAVDDRVLEYGHAGRCEDCTLVQTCGRPAIDVLEVPAVAFLVEVDLRRIVAFVKVLEDGGEDFRRFSWEFDAFTGGGEELSAAGFGEEF